MNREEELKVYEAIRDELYNKYLEELNYSGIEAEEFSLNIQVGTKRITVATKLLTYAFSDWPANFHFSFWVHKTDYNSIDEIKESLDKMIRQNYHLCYQFGEVGQHKRAGDKFKEKLLDDAIKAVNLPGIKTINCEDKKFFFAFDIDDNEYTSFVDVRDLTFQKALPDIVCETEYHKNFLDAPIFKFSVKSGRDKAVSAMASKIEERILAQEFYPLGSNLQIEEADSCFKDNCINAFNLAASQLNKEDYFLFCNIAPISVDNCTYETNFSPSSKAYVYRFEYFNIWYYIDESRAELKWNKTGQDIIDLMESEKGKEARNLIYKEFIQKGVHLVPHKNSNESDFNGLFFRSKCRVRITCGNLAKGKTVVYLEINKLRSVKKFTEQVVNPIQDAIDGLINRNRLIQLEKERLHQDDMSSFIAQGFINFLKSTPSDLDTATQVLIDYLCGEHPELPQNLIEDCVNPIVRNLRDDKIIISLNKCYGPAQLYCSEESYSKSNPHIYEQILEKFQKGYKLNDLETDVMIDKLMENPNPGQVKEVIQVFSLLPNTYYLTRADSLKKFILCKEYKEFLPIYAKMYADNNHIDDLINAEIYEILGEKKK